MLTKQQFNGKVSTIKSSSAKVRELVQELLVDAAYYVFKDRNLTPLMAILDAVGDGTRKAGIYAWAETFAPLRIVNDELKICKVEFAKYSITNEAEYLALIEETGAATTLWYLTVEKEKAVSVFDPSGYMSQVFKKLNKEGLPDLADHLAKAVETYNMQVALEEMAEAGAPVEQ